MTPAPQLAHIVEHMSYMSINGSDVHTPDRLGRRSTGELSSVEKSEQMDRTVRQVEALTSESNAHTAAIRALTEAHNRLSRGMHEVSTATAQMFYGRTFWQRLRWLMLGH